MKKLLLLHLIIVGLFFFSVSTTSAHQSGCHRWHSCPSDTGSYVCGDLGYTSGCYSSTYDSSDYSNYDSSDYSYPSTPTCPLNSYYDGSSSCKCNYGYVVDGGSCVSADSICHDQLGYSSSYDSLTESCKCSYGYMINGGQCVYGNTYCRSKLGLYSSYNSSSKSCECDSGYTLDDSNQCVKKQNNVYFKLLDVNTDNKQAIIKSGYDSRRYLITYGVGCFSSTISRYKNKDLVVNLGTDFDVDTWDTIVLQDDDQTCSITHRERTYEDSLIVEEEEELYNYYVPTMPTYDPPPETGGLLKQATPEPVSVVENVQEELTSSPTPVVESPIATTSDQSAREGIFVRIWKSFLGWFGK